MATSYSVESHECRSRDQLMTVENRTPARTWEEAEKVKAEIEDRLFDIFRKYVANQT